MHYRCKADLARRADLHCPGAYARHQLGLCALASTKCQAGAVRKWKRRYLPKHAQCVCWVGPPSPHRSTRHRQQPCNRSLKQCYPPNATQPERSPKLRPQNRIDPRWRHTMCRSSDNTLSIHRHECPASAPQQRSRTIQQRPNRVHGPRRLEELVCRPHYPCKGRL